jgi:hypothetical protein
MSLSFSVRCLFHWNSKPSPGVFLYEERITLWRAATIDEALLLAESEASQYAAENAVEFLDLLQAYALTDPLDASSVEVFSLLRESELPPKQYIDRHFDTGRERQSHHA